MRDQATNLPWIVITTSDAVTIMDTEGLWTVKDRIVQSVDGSPVSGIVPSRMTASDLALVTAAPALYATVKAAQYLLTVLKRANDAGSHETPDWGSVPCLLESIGKIEAALRLADGKE